MKLIKHIRLTGINKPVVEKQNLETRYRKTVCTHGNSLVIILDDAFAKYNFQRCNTETYMFILAYRK